MVGRNKAPQLDTGEDMARVLTRSEEAIYAVLPIIQAALYDDEGLDKETALRWIQHLLLKGIEKKEAPSP